MMSDNAFEEMRNRILALIESSGVEGINGRDICRRLGINKRLRNAALQDLLDIELIVSERIERESKKTQKGTEQTTLFFSNSDTVQNSIRIRNIHLREDDEFNDN